MKKSELKILLSKIKSFGDIEDLEPGLEQYSTSPEVASEFLNIAYVSGHIEGKKVIDLGCGTGILGIGASILGADKVMGIDKDDRVLKIAKENMREIEDEIGRELEMEFLHEDVRNIEDKVEKERFDTVVMNPPFGMKKKHRNLEFLKKACSTGEVIYALLHSPEKRKEKTRKFIKDYLHSFSREGEVLKRFEMRLPRTYKFHEKQAENVKADLWFIR